MCTEPGRVDWLVCLTWGTDLADRPGGLSRLMNLVGPAPLIDSEKCGFAVGFLSFLLFSVVVVFMGSRKRCS